MTSARRINHSDLPVPLVRVQGTPAECGRGYGAAARDLIVANLEFYLSRFRDEAGLDAAAVRAAGIAFRESTRRHHPRVAEMLDGVAEGADVRVDEIYALNARTELIYGNRRVREAAGAPHPDASAGRAPPSVSSVRTPGTAICCSDRTGTGTPTSGT